MFLFTGLLTVLMGIVFLLVIPDSQLNARWLNSRDKVPAVERVRVNQQGIGNKHFKVYQFKEALIDPMTWASFILAVATDITNGGLSNFFSQLIVSFGFTAEQSLLYGTPAGAVEVISLIAWGLMSQKWGNRVLLSIGGVVASLVGAILIVACPFEMKIARLIGYYLTPGYVIGFVSVLSLVSSNVAGYSSSSFYGFSMLKLTAFLAILRRPPSALSFWSVTVPEISSVRVTTRLDSSADRYPRPADFSTPGCTPLRIGRSNDYCDVQPVYYRATVHSLVLASQESKEN